MVKIKIQQTDKTLPLPKYETSGSAAVDLRSSEGLILKRGEFKPIKTGIKIAVPEGYEAQIRARSGLSAKHGISAANGVGTIDSDYRGEICAILINHGPEDFVINKGDRIAQMLINKVEIIEWDHSEDLDDTKRGSGGFGHTGI